LNFDCRLPLNLTIALDLSTPECQRCVKGGLKCGGCRGLTIVQYHARQGVSASRNTPSALHVHSAASQQLLGPGPASPTSLALSGFSDDTFVMYTCARVLRRGGDAIIQAGISRSLTGTCFTALSTTYFGVQHIDKSITQQGFQRYGRALGELNNALRDPTTRQSFDALEAVGIMALFEVSNSPCHRWNCFS
jgi:hypothetical protein